MKTKFNLNEIEVAIKDIKHLKALGVRGCQSKVEFYDLGATDPTFVTTLVFF